jgi:hypothetical protein
VVALPPWHPQRRFCAAVLEREVRLAYWDKVRETLPDALAALMPPQPGPAFPYGPPQGDHPAAPEAERALAQQLTGLVRDKKSSKEVGAHPRMIRTPRGLREAALCLCACPALPVLGPLWSALWGGPPQDRDGSRLLPCPPAWWRHVSRWPSLLSPVHDKSLVWAGRLCMGCGPGSILARLRPVCPGPQAEEAPSSNGSRARDVAEPDMLHGL